MSKCKETRSKIFGKLSDTQKASRIYISSPPPRVIVSHDVKIEETIMYRKLKDETAIQRIEPSIVKQQSINVPIDDTIGTDILVPDTVTSPTTVPDATSNHNAVSHHETAFRDEEEQQPAVVENNNITNDTPIEADVLEGETSTGTRRSSRLPHYTERYQAYRKSLGRQIVASKH